MFRRKYQLINIYNIHVCIAKFILIICIKEKFGRNVKNETSNSIEAHYVV